MSNEYDCFILIKTVWGKFENIQNSWIFMQLGLIINNPMKKKKREKKKENKKKEVFSIP